MSQHESGMAEEQTLLDLVEALRHDQCGRWRAGDRVLAEHYLQAHPTLQADLERSLEVVYQEILLREERGEAPRLEEYLQRFPQFSARLKPLFAVHQAVEAGGLFDSQQAATVVQPEQGEGEARTAASLPQVTGYEILGEVGRGGMGVVYRAVQRGLNRTVALKMILAGDYSGPQHQARFRTEAEAIGRLQHPNIVNIYEVGEQDGRPYLSMEFVDGGSLAQKLRGTPLPVREAAELVEILAQAVQHAHDRGIVHRDLTPANILLKAVEQETPARQEAASSFTPRPASRPIPKITDFGLAKILVGEQQVKTQTGAVLGTPSYMAPEQAGGQHKEIGPAADIYALGSILYEMLTGRPPFRAETALETLLQVQTEDPVPPSRLRSKMPRDLETICLKCLEKPPDRRYRTSQLLSEDLRSFLAGAPISARPASAAEKLLHWAKRRPAAAALIVVSILAVLALSGSAWWHSFRLEKALAAETEARQQAQAKEEQAQTARRDAERNSYHAAVALAARAWPANQVQQAIRFLDDCPAEMRDWEWHYLKRLCQTGTHTFPGLPNSPASAALSPDGRWLAAVSGQRGKPYSITLCDTTTGQARLTLRGPAEPINAVVFSPDGRRIAAGCGAWQSRSAETTVGEIRFWDAVTGAEVMTIQGHAGRVNSIAFSPDGKYLASAAAERDNVVKLWDAVTGRAVRSFRGLGSFSECVAFRPDGKWLAAASRDSTAKVWEVGTGQEVSTLRGHSRIVSGVAFSPDGRRLATSSIDRTVKIWEAATGRELRTIFGHTQDIQCVAFSPDGRLLASAGKDHLVKLWDAASGQELNSYRGHESMIQSVAFSPEGRRLVSAGSSIKLWDVQDKQEALELRGHSSGVWSVAFSPDGRHLATGGLGAVRLWDAKTGIDLRSFREPHASIHALAFSPDGRQIASGDSNGSIAIWDAVTGQRNSQLRGHSEDVQGLAFSPDGRRLASASRDQSIKVWDLATGHSSLTIKAGTVKVVFSPDGRHLAGGDWVKEEGELARIWDADTGQIVLSLKGHEAYVSSLAYSPDGKQLATGSVDRSVRIWDTATGHELATLHGHAHEVWAVAFGPNGKRLVSGSVDGVVRLWDTVNRREILTLLGHTDYVADLAFSADGRRIASVGQDQTVRIWDAAPVTPESRQELEAGRVVRFYANRELLKPAVLEAIRRDPSLAESLRRQALALADQWQPDADRYNDASWDVVWKAGGSPESYRQALAWAEEACRLAPDEGFFLNTLGVAQYRVGNYTQALQTLAKSDQINKERTPEKAGLIQDLAFLAMTYYRLDQKDKARATLARIPAARLRILRNSSQETRAILAEAEKLLGISGKDSQATRDR